MRKRLATTSAVVFAALVLAPIGASTIHPIVESFDCANQQAFANHPLGDPADPPGQTLGATPGDGQNELAAINNTSAPNFGHGIDGECGHAGP